MNRLTFVMLCVLAVATTPRAAEAQKMTGKVIADDFLPDYESVQPLADQSAAIVRLRVSRSQMRKFDVPGRKLPAVLMEHAADVLEVIKGNVSAAGRLVFLQRAGAMDVGAYKVEYDVPDEQIPQAGEELVVFLRWNPGLQHFELLSTRQGLYRLEGDSVVPKGKGQLARRYMSANKTTFMDEVRAAVRAKP